MEALRENFHALSNQHHKITVAAGVTLDVLGDIDTQTLSPAARAALAQAKDACARIEKYALLADETVQMIKKDVCSGS